MTTSTAAPPTMTAVVQRGYGSTDVMHVEHIATPEPMEGQVLVRVHAAGLDRGVWHIMAGLPYIVRPMFGMTTPRQPVPGLDVAGVVVALGAGVTDVAVGDAVFGTADGSFAEYAVADAAKLARIPAGIGFDEAAAVPVSGLAALEAVREHGLVEPGHRVLVIGASGGVGGYAVQIAAAVDAEVVGVASAAKADFVRSLGAARCLDYATTDVTALPDRYDVVIDINGRLPLGRLERILTPTGVLVIVGGENGGALTGGIQRQFGARIRSLFTRRRLGFFISSESRAGLHELVGLLESGAVRPTVDTVRPLSAVREAIDDLLAGRILGKAVIHVTD
ncbi:NAD(P)-dependent alcohol dehydrogenase [Microbacterium sp. LRZ72]|uniref:NAD(P)-dependent alcohol dehydrogenase n=1 Tax=Microbacterium sp. LRZ72 TaxID=2942481 RepID=UPI0029BB3CCA|nr:NAD(P)-dependent alcohol dehydrogenase [Microbacterium sp. LRZ72]MDX2376507.1 NAD(P)-dependent alcohol dehydrogenase [Microbacterium sp. LRZ72]